MNSMSELRIIFGLRDSYGTSPSLGEGHWWVGKMVACGMVR